MWSHPRMTENTRIALLGDLHANVEVLRRAIEKAAAVGVHELIVLGDAGLWWNQRTLAKARRDPYATLPQKWLEEAGSRLWLLAGNHEDHNLIDQARLHSAPWAFGFGAVSDRITWLPRAHVFEAAGRRVGVLSGANSIDRFQRRPAKPGVLGYGSWWSQESITDSDVTTLVEQAGDRPLDVLLGHEQPSHTLIRQFYDARGNGGWPLEALAYAHESRAQFDRATELTRPKLTAGGHYHRFMSVPEWTTPGGHNLRSIGLGMEGESGFMQILDLEDLALHEVSIWTKDALEWFASRGVHVGFTLTDEQLEDAIPKAKAREALGEKVLAVHAGADGEAVIEVEHD